MTLLEIVEREGLPCVVEHEDGLRYQVIGIDPFKPAFFFCKRVSGTKPIERGGDAWLWRYSRGYRVIPTKPKYISPEKQRESRTQDRAERNARQVRDLTKGRPAPRPPGPEGGKVIPFRRKDP